MKIYRTLLLVIIILITCNLQGQTLITNTMPEFTFYKFDNNKFTSKELPKNKLKFFIYFDSDCDHCQQAIKNIDQVVQNFNKTAIFLVSLDNPEKINHFMDKFGPRLKARKNVLLLQDRLNEFLPKFKPRQYPSMFLFSADNKLIDYEDNAQTIFRFVNIINKKN
jgi:thiol-disulfide isomerase/thioredoxin